MDGILSRTVADLALRREEIPIGDLVTTAMDVEPALSLRVGLDQPGMSVIAEIKRASPSRGVFPVEVDASAVAAEYISGGAAAISVLTDEPFFRGSLRDLEEAAVVAHRPNASVPILRKDFIIDRYQVVEARARGADAVLLIVAALSDATLATL
ncbi:MAG: indole-3-glycerol-phosphate synthase TrpC, partial [Chloroflexia bacterium]|nr:indole-3-glycerol-phosphate synthase TrpC [Chloroflexia bacterium]